MEKLKLKEILSCYYKESTVNAIVRGDRKPSYEIILDLHYNHGVPFDSWKDIESFINETISEDKNQSK